MWEKNVSKQTWQEHMKNKYSTSKVYVRASRLSSSCLRTPSQLEELFLLMWAGLKNARPVVHLDTLRHLKSVVFRVDWDTSGRAFLTAQLGQHNPEVSFYNKTGGSWRHVGAGYSTNLNFLCAFEVKCLNNFVHFQPVCFLIYENFNFIYKKWETWIKP